MLIMFSVVYTFLLLDLVNKKNTFFYFFLCTQNCIDVSVYTLKSKSKIFFNILQRTVPTIYDYIANKSVVTTPKIIK